MFIHTLSPVHKLKSPKRIGRGGKKGTYSGRGMKGQKARSGSNQSPLFAGGAPTLIGRGTKFIHKKRGVGNTVSASKKQDLRVINIVTLDKFFDDKELINPITLIAKGILGKNVKVIKILGKGKSDKKFIFEDVQLSKSIKEHYSL